MYLHRLFPAILFLHKVDFAFALRPRGIEIDLEAKAFRTECTSSSLMNPITVDLNVIVSILLNLHAKFGVEDTDSDIVAGNDNDCSLLGHFLFGQ